MEEKSFELNNTNEAAVWQAIEKDLVQYPFEYSAVFKEDALSVHVKIDIDPGGGFESGYAFTTFLATVPVSGFSFALHPQDFIDEIGKFFGMQDVKIGREAFDDKVVVKTNDETLVRQLLSDEGLQMFWQQLDHYKLLLTAQETGNSQLALEMEEGITAAKDLRKLYHAFTAMAKALQNLGK